MPRSQPQFVIKATSRCKTHRPGDNITYTGPRSGIPAGWSVISGPSYPTYGSGTV